MDVRRTWARVRAVLVGVALLVGILGLLPAVPAAAASGTLTFASPFTLSVGVADIACAGPELCVGADGTGLATSTDPAGGSPSWSTTSAFDAGLDAVSCPSTSLCVAADTNGNVVTATQPTLGASAWTVRNVDGTNGIYAVSCPTASLCVAVDGAGNVLTSTDPAAAGSWSIAAVEPGLGLFYVSCPAANLCVAPSSSGYVLVSTDPAGGAGSWSRWDIAGSSSLTGMSCPTTTLCVAVSNSGNIYTSEDPAGGAGAWTESASGTVPIGSSTVDCPSANECWVGEGMYGDVSFTTDPTGTASAWSALSQPFSSVRTIACANAGLCLMSNGTEMAVASGSQATAATLSASPASAGGSATWTYGFTTSSTGALAAGTDTITLSGPTGTVFPSAAADYTVDGTAVTAAPAVSGASVTITLPVAVADSTAVTVVATNMTNPSAGTDPASDFSVYTSQDLYPANPASGITFTSLGITTASLPAGLVGSAYDETLAATGGTSPYTWSLAGGSLPAGLGLNGVSGAVYGTPTGYGTSSFTVEVTDSASDTATASLSLTIDRTAANAVTLGLAPSSVAAGGQADVVGAVYAPSGAPLADTQVTLSLARGFAGESPGTIAPTTVTTDTYGAFAATLTAPADSGAVTVTAAIYGASAEAVEMVTPVGTTVSQTATATATGPCATVDAGAGTTQATGCGSGQLVVAEYTAAPTQTAPLAAAAGYFDTAVSTGNTFTTVTIERCGVQATDGLQWWNDQQAAWQAVAPAATYSGGCLTFAVSSSTSPSLSDLYGTVFAVVASSGGGGTSGNSGYVAAASPTATPAVTGLSQATGAPGSSLTISGSGLTGVTAVTFGTVPAASFQVVSDSAITAVVPEGQGTVTVFVTNAAGTAAAGQFTYVAACASSPQFSDVPATAPEFAAVQLLACRGVVNGYPGGAFQPQAPVSRAQFVKMLDLALGLKPAGDATQFTDVAASAWYAPYVAVAVSNGIVRGVTAVLFAPDAGLTREQMAVLLARGLHLTATGTAALSFSDAAAIAPWAAPDVAAAVAAGYLHGLPDGTFQPLAPTTRADAAYALAAVVQGAGD